MSRELPMLTAFFPPLHRLYHRHIPTIARSRVMETADGAVSQAWPALVSYPANDRFLQPSHSPTTRSSLTSETKPGSKARWPVS